MGSDSEMPAARLGDIDTGHPPAPPTPIITGSTDVFINGRPAARQGDMLAPHHPGVRIITEGSASVFISTGSAYRALKDINCGSSNFLAGEHLIFLRDGYSPYDESFVYEFRDDAGKTKSWLMPEGASENDWKSCFIPA